MDAKGAFIEENCERLYKEWQHAYTNMSLADYIESQWEERNEGK